MTAAFAPAQSAFSGRRAHGGADERTYRRRRAVVGVVAAAIVTLGGVAVHDVLAGPGGVPASAAGATPAPTDVHIVARSGDTMWGIAERFHGDIPIDRYVEALVERNGGPWLQEGQTVHLP
jgi:nucleoid-associated protein YgaU